MSREPQASSVREWTCWITRILAWGVFAFVAVFLPTLQGETLNTYTLSFTGIILFVTSIVLIPFAYFPNTSTLFLLLLVLADMAMAASFAYVRGGDFVSLLIGLLSLLIAGIPITSRVWGIAHCIGVIVGAIGALYIQNPSALQSAVQLLSVLFVFSAFVMVIHHLLDSQYGGLRRLAESANKARNAQTLDLQERTQALTELAFNISTRLDYSKVLTAALDAGRLALRSSEMNESHVVSAVLLFHADDNALHVVSSRKMGRSDENRIIEGQTGAIAEALAEAEPIYNIDPSQDPELQYFVAFQACRSALLIPLRANFDNFGVIVYASERPNAFTGDYHDLMKAVGIQATVALQNALLYTNLQQEKERIIEVEEEARKKLARDLHDGPTQSVAAIAMRMSYIIRLIQSTPEAAPSELKKVEDLARRTTQEIRHMLFTLRPLVLETQGINVALQQLAEKMHELHGQQVSVRSSRDIDLLLDMNQQGVVFYIVEEAINNARKHAKARQIDITLQKQNNFVVIKIADNGVGFDQTHVNTGYDQRGSFGMMNMRERAALLNGQLTVESSVGRGTTITVIIPVQDALGSNSKSQKANATSGSAARTKLAVVATERFQNRDRLR